MSVGLTFTIVGVIVFFNVMLAVLADKGKKEENRKRDCQQKIMLQGLKESDERKRIEYELQKAKAEEERGGRRDWYA